MKFTYQIVLEPQSEVSIAQMVEDAEELRVLLRSRYGARVPQVIFTHNGRKYEVEWKEVEE